MAIGNLGSTISFIVNNSKVLTFNSMVRTVSGRWVNNPVIGQKGISQFTGPELEQLSFSITVDASLGVSPSDVLKKINHTISYGIAETLVIGGIKIGSNRWKILSASESYNHFLQDGKLVRADINLTLEEFYT